MNINIIEDEKLKENDVIVEIQCFKRDEYVDELLEYLEQYNCRLFKK